MWHVWEIKEMHSGFWWVNLRERAHSKDPGIDGKIILKLIFKQWNAGTNRNSVAQDRDG
jgi:hypothetical protein